MRWSAVLPFLIGWSCGWFLLARRRPLGPAVDDRPSVAVVVPARDEATTLPDLLGSVVPQLRPGDELVVVDDGSTDGTADVARRLGARVTSAPPLAPGWSGKAAACHAGAAATGAPVLAFLDADVRLEPGGLDRVVAEVVRHPGALVSVQPWHRMPRPVEQLSVPFSLVAVAGTGLWSPLGIGRAPAVAYGPVLATARRDYERVGGHAHPAVRGSVVDDIALARRYDGDVRIALDRSAATFRMYPAGLRPLVQGWTKNIATGAASVPWWAFAATAAWLWSIVGAPAAGWPCWLASAVQLLVLGRRVGQVRWWSALLGPVLAVWFLLVLARSALVRARRRPVRWRGRDVPAV